MSAPTLQVLNDRQDAIRLGGEWTIDHADTIVELLSNAPTTLKCLDARQVEEIDSLGVLQLRRFVLRRKLELDDVLWHREHSELAAVIDEVADERPKSRREIGLSAALSRLGKSVTRVLSEFRAGLGFFGEVLVKFLRTAVRPGRLRFTSVVSHMESTGLDAVPLVALLCFMVGAVVAFLGANVLKDFGAEIYVVELVNISFLREFGVLLAAILLAGRTASSYTASLGSMVNREEVDAIRTLGLDPIEVLVLPRILAIVLTLPMLAFVADLAGLLGGLVVGAYSLDIPPQQYLSRMHDTIESRHFWVGMSKAPIFALVIGTIGCLEGLTVKGTTTSLGEHTTSAVVQSISTVIVIDALMAMFYMTLDV
ncbi:MlaE family ABC transporter permease [Aquilutibacter rugosus]|uniref:MlaE family ABC transporter permease n=1 Tax=Aquilutibacter rugosus TaxID=3115820 RepID=UPI002F406656